MSSEQNEAKIPLDEIIKKLAEQIEKLTKIIEKSTKSISDNTDTNKDWHKYQAMMKIELEKEHGRQVRLNKDYARSSQSLEMFTGLLSRGASMGLVFKSLTSVIGGVSKELDKYKAEHTELIRMEKEFGKKGINVGRGDLEKAGNEMEREQHRRQQEQVDKAKEGKGGKEGKLAEGISSMKEFANKHKTGILIGAGSVGILLTVLKKAFDVSPMFQAIKKLLQFGFMLILRPIGDFFGFIMRPIMVMMLRKFIIPWYKDVYPVMKKLGTWIGNQLVPTMEGILTWLSTPVGTATAVGVGTAAAVGVPAATLLTLKKIMNWLGTSGSKTTGSTSGAANAVANLQKSVTSLRAKVVQFFKHPKMVITQITKNIGARIKSFTTSIKTAFTNVRSSISTTATKIRTFFTKTLGTSVSKISTRISSIGTKLTTAVQKVSTEVGKILPKITSTIKNVTSTLSTKLGQILPKITTFGKNLAQTLGAKIAGIIPNLQKGVGSITNAFAGLTKGGGAFSNLSKTLGNLLSGKNLGKVGGKGGIIGLIAMLTEGTIASPETLGGLIDKDDPNRLDKNPATAWLFGNKLSEDAEGNFKTVSAYGQWLADVTNNPDMQEGIVNQMYSGEATGIGGGAREDWKDKKGTTVIINVDHINNDMDLKHVGEYVSESLAVDNKKTAGT